MELIFRALGDPSRRLLLDLLFQTDGQTLTQLESQLAMTRFGVMKHLRLLESAGLINTRRSGREKFHYLNPVPIQLIHQRWISKYAAPMVEAIGRIKAGLEGSVMSTKLEEAVKAPRHVYEVYIRTTPEKLWQAITDPAITKQYYYGTAAESDWTPGATLVYREANGSEAIRGKILEADPPRKLVHTFGSTWTPEMKAERPSRVTWEIEPQGEVCKLTLVHDDFDGETETYKAVGSGWNPVLSGLKTLLETGKPLAIGG